MVVSWNSSNWPLTKRSTRLDLPTAMSPSSTNLNWQILVCGSVPLERPPLPLELILNLCRSRRQGKGGGWGAGPPPWGGDGCFWDASVQVSKVSASARGYLQDVFLQHSVCKAASRALLINRSAGSHISLHMYCGRPWWTVVA
ncbi:hypothetical protein EYF80_010714 [Liparis tanakae]|uniref:Uncharacterized protein n=1 Tax=Liparis tanakae TaxID=230148 RepID=A0A4Z2IME9_9TELE|nr:hypothetical protein EYF80_010714 [Liparis tanakae]